MPRRKDPMHAFQKAASFAAVAHHHQFRKDGVTPYFAHCVRVTLVVTDVFGFHDELAICAALLHDTIEDTTTDYDDLEEEFGKPIADAVGALTKNMILPEETREKDYDARLAKADWRVRLVKLADAYDNYIDAVNRGDSSKKDSRREKAQRAIALAQKDTAKHPQTKRAIAALKKLISGKG
jgi:guanosine-3',5'-bis(diphosphate) 3'-pyrophosphohydrolase